MSAKDVTVETLYRARCNRDGCDWKGEFHRTSQEAQADREAHLTDPRCKGIGAQPSLLGEDPELTAARQALDLIALTLRSTLPADTAFGMISDALGRTGREVPR